MNGNGQPLFKPVRCGQCGRVFQTSAARMDHKVTAHSSSPLIWAGYKDASDPSLVI